MIGWVTKRKRPYLCRATAWVLAIIMVLSGVSPAMLVTAAQNGKDNWEVFYSLSLNEDEGISVGNEDGEVIVAAQAGREVYFTMQLLADDVEDARRFKETFSIKLPGAVYKALVDENGDPNEWFLSDLTECEYLLELKEDPATPSSAHTASNASPADADDDIVELKFQFVEELRKESDPELVELPESEYTIAFTMPEDMILVCSTDGNDCEIVQADMSMINMFGDTLTTQNKYWTLDFSASVNDEPSYGGNYDSETTIKFSFYIKVKDESDESDDRYTDVFQLRIDKDVYNLITGIEEEGDTEKYPIQWPKASGNMDTGMAFKNPVGVLDESTNEMVFTLDFADWYKEGKASAMSKHLVEAQFDFIFKVKNKSVVRWNKKNDNATISITCEPYVDPDLKFRIYKDILYAFNENGQTDMMEVKKGDYLLYKITAYVDYKKDIYTIPAGSIVDYFNGDLFELVDISDDINSDWQTIKELADNAFDTDPNFSRNLNYYLAMDEEQRAWMPVNASKVPDQWQKENCVYYGNAKDNVLDKYNYTTLYMCMQIKDDLSEAYEESDLTNYVYWDLANEIKAKHPGIILREKYYDAKIRISPTTRMPVNGNSGIALNSRWSITYPSILRYENAMIRDGDLVTFGIYADANANQNNGDLSANINRINIYLPLGYDIVDVSDIPDNYRYARRRFNDEYASGSYDPKDYPHVSLADEALVDTGELHKFAEYDWAKSYNYDYADFYQVRRYTYTFDSEKLDPVQYLYITCRVKGTNKILDMLDKERTEINEQYAAEFGYLITAEVADMLNIKTGESVAHLDVDSYLDDDPFNDWFNMVSKKVKLYRDKLYIDTGSNRYGEKDDNYNIVRNLIADNTKTEKERESQAHNDEDDFDFAILAPYKVRAVIDNGSVFKKIDNSSTYRNDLKGSFYQIDKKFDLSGKNSYRTIYEDRLIGYDSVLYDVDIVVPYVVDINKQGIRDMHDVMMVDQLPQSMKFLTDPDGKPIFAVYERIEKERFEMTDKDGKTVYEIREDASTLIRVKDYWSDHYNTDYYTVQVTEDQGFIPTKVAANGNVWDYKLDEGSNTLTVNFGDIKDNSYVVVYAGIIDKFSQSYENNVSLAWDEQEDGASVMIKSVRASAGSREYGKTVSLNPFNPELPAGGFGKQKEVVKTNPDGSLDVYYCISLDITANKDGDVNYDTGSLLFTDKIDDLYGGKKTDNVIIPEESVVIRDMYGDEYVNPPYDVIINQAAREISINNNKPINDTTVCYVYFNVHYNEIPNGTTIKNTFVNTTRVKTPLKIDVTKLDGKNEIVFLKKAGFTLSYDKAGDYPVIDTQGEPFRLTTDDNGNDFNFFYPDETYEDENGEYLLYLREIRVPGGYYELGGIDRNPEEPYLITLKVIKDGDDYTVSAVPAGADDQTFYEFEDYKAHYGVRLKVKNYVRDTNGIIEVYKDLAGRDLEKDEFSFYATLEKVLVKSARDEVEVLFDGGVLSEGGSTRLEAANQKNGMVLFPKLTFNRVGHYIFAIHEIDDNQEGVAYDTTVYYADVIVTEESLTKVLSTDINYYKTYNNGVLSDPCDGIPEYKNRFSPAQVELELNKKLLHASTGETQSLAEQQFEFKLELASASDAVKLPAQTTVLSETGSGAIRFGSIEFTKTGIYNFIITEVPRGGHLPGHSISYDPGTIRVTVVVNEVNDKLTARLTYQKTEPSGSEYYYDEDSTKKDQTFVNFVHPDSGFFSTSVILEAEKRLIGRDLTADEFAFKANLVYASNDAEIDDLEATNDADGDILFPAFSFDQAGIYIFEISETAGNDSKIDYDSAKYFVRIIIRENRIGELETAEIRYGSFHDESAHTVSGANQKPVFDNFVKESRYLELRKESKSGGNALAGAEFELSYRRLGSNGEWEVLYGSLVTAGAKGNIMIKLPESFDDYEYRLIETKAPAGYTKTNVGTIYFTLTSDGIIDIHNIIGGADGYVELTSENMILVVKNGKSPGGGGNNGGGGGDNPKPPTPTIPTTPTAPGNGPGDGNPSSNIDSGSTPLAQLNSFITENVIPLTGLVKTGDYQSSVLLLGGIMLTAAVGFCIVSYRKKKQTK